MAICHFKSEQDASKLLNEGGNLPELRQLGVDGNVEIVLLVTEKDRKVQQRFAMKAGGMRRGQGLNNGMS